MGSVSFVFVVNMFQFDHLDDEPQVHQKLEISGLNFERSDSVDHEPISENYLDVVPPNDIHK